MARKMSVDGLGICEHCGTIVSVEDMTADSMDAIWKCPNPECGKELGAETFGYEAQNGRHVRTRWVGPVGKWMDKRPVNEFSLKSWWVVLEKHGPIHI